MASACVPPHPFPLVGTEAVAPGQLFLCDPCIFSVQGSCPCPWCFRLTENLIVRFGLAPVPQEEQSEQKPAHPFGSLQCAGAGRCQPGLRSCSREGWEAGCLLVRRLPVCSVEGLCTSALAFRPVSFP